MNNKNRNQDPANKGSNNNIPNSNNGKNNNNNNAGFGSSGNSNSYSDRKQNSGSNSKSSWKDKQSTGSDKNYQNPSDTVPSSVRIDKEKRTNGNSNIVNMKGSLSFVNLATGTIASKSSNKSVLNVSYDNSVNQYITIDYTILPLIEVLQAQARVWAQNMENDSSLYLKNILGPNVRDSKWSELLEQAYIYSYYRALLYAVNKSNSSEFSKTSCVTGHAIMYSVIIRPRMTFSKNGQTVVFKLNIERDEYEKIIEQVKSFNFLSKAINNFPFFSFELSKFNRILNGLSEAMTNGMPQFSYISPLNSHCDRYLTLDTCAVFNSLYTSSSKKEEWFYIFQQGSTILDSSTMVGKALFFTSKEDNILSKYYDKMDNDTRFATIRYEVNQIAGSYYPPYDGVVNAK